VNLGIEGRVALVTASSKGLGRASAVADLNFVKLSGPVAWLGWLAVHLFYLIGFQNRYLVLIRWSYSYVTHGRGARLITEPPPPPGA